MSSCQTQRLVSPLVFIQCLRPSASPAITMCYKAAADWTNHLCSTGEFQTNQVNSGRALPAVEPAGESNSSFTEISSPVVIELMLLKLR